MKVFYWSPGLGVHNSRFFQVDGDLNFVAEVPTYEVRPEMIAAMLDAGFVEISRDTAHCLGLPL